MPDELFTRSLGYGTRLARRRGAPAAVVVAPGRDAGEVEVLIAGEGFRVRAREAHVAERERS